MSRKKRVSPRKVKKPTIKKPSKSPLIFSALLVVVVTFVITITIIKVSEFIISQQNHNFPKLEISLADVTLEQVNLDSKDAIYYGNTATFTIDQTVSTFNGIELKGRGNTTWVRPKKPYQIKLPEKASVFNLAPAKKWLLLANYIDPSHLRNDTAFYLEKLLGDPYALSGDFLEVYFDNSYNGLYYLSEKVEAKKSRVNLKDEYGIIVEFDNVYGGYTGCHYDISGNCLTVSDAVNPDVQDFAMESFINDFNSLQVAIENQDHETITNLIDVDSFAKYYLLNEFAVNPDAYSTSFYLYRNGEDDKIHAGPGWDFDVAFGNTDWTPESLSDSTFHSPFETTPLKTFIVNNSGEEDLVSIPISKILYDLADLPEFSTHVKEIYQSTLSGHGEELLAHIKSQADYIRDAAYRDQARWKLKTDFDEEVDYLIDWVAKRYEHFEEIYGATPDPAPESPQP